MAAFMYATYLLIISKLGKESSINIIFYTTLFTGLFGLIPALIESRDFLPTSKAQLYNLFAMAILCQVGGQFFITYSMPRLTASYGSIGLLMQPIVATIFGALIFYEYLNFIQLGFVILALIIYSGFSFLSLKLMLIPLFILFTSPISSHAISLFAHESGLKPKAKIKK